MATPTNRKFTWNEIRTHCNEQSCWIVLHGNVVDATSFLHEHPGSSHIILGQAGHDATDAFEAIGHSQKATNIWMRHSIGIVEDEDAVPLSSLAVKQESQNAPSSSGVHWKWKVLVALLAALLLFFGFGVMPLSVSALVTFISLLFVGGSLLPLKIVVPLFVASVGLLYYIVF